MFFGYRIVRRRVRRRRAAGNTAAYAKHKEEARALVHARLEHFNKFYNFSYKDVRIKNVKTRWGSCSRKGNLNFNYRVALLPPDLLDYIVVHELCHLGEFNHSDKFWALVALTLPDYRELRERLRGRALR